MRPRVRRARRDRRAEQHDDRRVAEAEPEAYQSCRPPRLRAIDTSDARSLPVDSRVDAVDAKPALRWDMFHAESAPRRACGPRCRWRRCGRSRRRALIRSRARAGRAPRAPGCAAAEREEHHEQDAERQRDAEQCSARDGVVLRRAQRRELLVIPRVDDRRRRVCILSSRRLRRRALRSCGASLRVLRTPRIVLRLSSRASSAA